MDHSHAFFGPFGPRNTQKTTRFCPISLLKVIQSHFSCQILVSKTKKRPFSSVFSTFFVKFGPPKGLQHRSGPLWSIPNHFDLVPIHFQSNSMSIQSEFDSIQSLGFQTISTKSPNDWNLNVSSLKVLKIFILISLMFVNYI